MRWGSVGSRIPTNLLQFTPPRMVVTRLAMAMGGFGTAHQKSLTTTTISCSRPTCMMRRRFVVGNSSAGDATGQAQWFESLSAVRVGKPLRAITSMDRLALYSGAGATEKEGHT